MSEPVPECCEEARYAVYFSVDYENHHGGPGWRINVRESARREAYKESREYLPVIAVPYFCPFCARPLPEFRRKENPPEPMCQPCDALLYCETCGERLQACDCHELAEAWEIVPTTTTTT